MSLILDALKKSEREQEGLDPLGDDGLQPAYTYSWTTDRRVLVLLASVAFLTLLVIGLLALLLWPRTAHTPGAAVMAEQRVEEEPEIQRPPPVADTRPPAPRPAPSAPLQASSPQSVDPQIQALYGTQVDQTVAQVAEPPPVRAAQPGTALTPEQQHIDAVWRQMQDESQRESQEILRRAERSNAQRAQAAARATAEPAPTVAPGAPAGTAAVDTAAVDTAAAPDSLAARAEIPFLHDLSSVAQSAIPTMMYSRHNYAEGWVTINKKRLHQGDRVADGLVVEQLLADGLVLRMHDTAFRLSALNSWVNN